MGRLKRIIAGIAAIFSVIVCFAGIPVSALPDEIVPLWGPYLTGAGETCMTVNWRTEESQAGSVEYATGDFYNSQGSYSDSVSDMAAELHHVQLTGLSPDTTYHYRLEIGGQYTADYTFTTFGSESFTFIVYGDTREQAPMYTQLERHKLVADRIAEEENVLFVLHTGDLVCDDSDLQEWGRFFESTRNMMSGVPLFPVLGNHESSSGAYSEAFNVPDWYSFDCSNAHFSMLDTNQGLQDQTEWLDTGLACDADWKF
ncbi:MAG: fibronectin type III domain-containing protein, partial [Dehalococcoidia bacterium]